MSLGRYLVCLKPLNQKNTHTHRLTLTEPTRYVPHRQDNMLRSIADSVKVFTQNSQDAHLGAVLLRAQGSPTQCNSHGTPRGFAGDFILPLL